MLSGVVVDSNSTATKFDFSDVTDSFPCADNFSARKYCKNTETHKQTSSFQLRQRGVDTMSQALVSRCPIDSPTTTEKIDTGVIRPDGDEQLRTRVTVVRSTHQVVLVGMWMEPVWCNVRIDR